MTGSSQKQNIPIRKWRFRRAFKVFDTNIAKNLSAGVIRSVGHVCHTGYSGGNAGAVERTSEVRNVGPRGVAEEVSRDTLAAGASVSKPARAVRLTVTPV